MSQTFRPGAPDDLVHPRAGASTARALVSFAQRSLFEARATLRVASLEGTHEDAAVARWLDIVSGMLPGSPHAVAHTLRDPAVFVPARMSWDDGPRARRAARAFVGSALLGLAREGALSVAVELPFAVDAFALRHGVRVASPTRSIGAHTPLTTLPAVEGRLLALEDGPWTALGCVRLDAAHYAERTRALRLALAHLARVAPAERADLDRLASGFVWGARLDVVRPLGLAIVPADARTTEALARAIAVEIVREKLALLRLADPLTEPLGPLTALCEDTVRARFGEGALAPLRARLATLRAEQRFSDVGAGIVEELGRILA